MGRRSRRKLERDKERLVKFLFMKRSQGEDIDIDLIKMYTSLRSDASFRVILKVRQLVQYGAKALVDNHVKNQNLRFYRLIILKIKVMLNTLKIEKNYLNTLHMKLFLKCQLKKNIAN